MRIRDLNWKVRQYSIFRQVSMVHEQAAREEAESQPVSRVLSRAAIPLGPASPQASSGLPGSTRGRALQPLAGLRLPYLALLQVGFAMPSRVATDAVRSYRTVSPLPALLRALRRSTLCCTFRRLTPPRYYLAPCPPSPDFPPRFNRMKCSDCSADSPPRHLSMAAQRRYARRGAQSATGPRRSLSASS